MVDSGDHSSLEWVKLRVRLPDRALKVVWISDGILVFKIALWR